MCSSATSAKNNMEGNTLSHGTLSHSKYVEKSLKYSTVMSIYKTFILKFSSKIKKTRV